MEYWVNVEPGVGIYVNDINPEGEHPILFLHGWPINQKIFEYQYNALINNGIRCIGMDARGFGQSGKPVYGYGYDRSADDVHRVIDALGARDLTLLGHSTAGAVAARYMARHNGHGVRRLVLCAAAAPSLVERPGFPEGVPEQTVLDIIRDTENDRPQTVDGFSRMFYYQPVTEPFIQWNNDLGMQAASWATIAVSHSWLRETLFDDLPEIRVPTLILHGIHDEIVPFALGEVQNEMIPNSRLVRFENSGHGLFYDEKEKFNAELMGFVTNG
ncbi:MAG TPA: alpha/beta hydrolase [Feifaniaceae bacterium]|nr:alpha/beta hydrolase [Feifaniaceae bacterium]